MRNIVASNDCASGITQILFLRPAMTGIATVLALGVSGAALAQSQPSGSDAVEDGGGSQEIIVTAQKRAQSINNVPMTITAATGAQLQDRGIKDTGDLVKITSGFTFAKSETGTPVYTLRGIGYDGTSIASRQAVSLYMDEAPIPFAVESRGAQLDLERVEILKGPQGTLFGNNSTGGAINFIANKPTSTLQTGATLTYGRFNQLDISGFVSGPITDTLTVRVAVEHQGGGNWQKSYTRDDTSGSTNFINGRLTVLWKPTDRFSALVTLNRWVDQSDFIYPQAVQLLNAGNPNFGVTGLQNYPAGPRGNRDADWTPGADASKNNRYLNLTGRLSYELLDNLTLTSLTTYIDYKNYLPADDDGVPTRDLEFTLKGTSKTFAQELRLSTKLNRLNLLVGANYERDLTDENPFLNLADSLVAYNFSLLTGTSWNNAQLFSRQRYKTYAGFANAEFELTPELTLQGGLRYTQSNMDFVGCTADSGDGSAAGAFTAFANLVRAGAGLGPIPAIQPGGCITLNSATLTPGLVRNTLKENNLSWRAGVQYKPSRDILLYANLSKGYKGGGYPLNASTFDSVLDPATQESVLAYEAGFKAGLLNRSVQLNGALFYSDYHDKQVTGTVIDPVAGALNKLVNIPKSRIYGAELEAMITPFDGLTLNANGSYIQSDVLDHYTNVDTLGVTRDFNRTDLPYVPRWQFNGGARYQWTLNERLDAFASVNATYQSRSNTGLGELAAYTIKPYTLVDASAGIQNPDGKWRAYVWGRNLLGTTYWSGTYRFFATNARFMGMPATYGVTLAVQY